ncbi:uncharacterized protein LOC133928521 isoform X1 [Phragmites australis]|uniref:uncharacterized protein LOC133928521 isoform X1 n=1 Tax=Phragmites australis TaxID=29695 RepID=UPI002D799597|nr:uncharacterized protein LOC133928521 isoform X1 [Phragmites australis]
MEQEQKGETSSGVYTYKHHCETGVDIHEIFVKKSRSQVLLSYIGIVFLLANVCHSLLEKERLCLGSIWNITFAILFARCLRYKPVRKESVVIMPAFGVQLEIHFWSGRVDRHFVPIGKIMKTLLNECVTPVTCYWSLALLLRDEDELLVFQKFRPPVKMLVPVWKVLCTFTNLQFCLNVAPNMYGKMQSLVKQSPLSPVPLK